VAVPGGMTAGNSTVSMVRATLYCRPDDGLGDAADDAASNPASLGLALGCGSHLLLVLHAFLSQPLLRTVEEHVSAVAEIPDPADDKQETDKSAIVARCKQFHGETLSIQVKKNDLHDACRYCQLSFAQSCQGGYPHCSPTPAYAGKSHTWRLRFRQT
jgi:hypothetical protein